MLPIYFKYEESTKQYIYIEQLVEYRMPLSLMLNFKKYLRENANTAGQNIKLWLNSLSASELRKISIGGSSSST
jgi:hypothetical protein